MEYKISEEKHKKIIDIIQSMAKKIKDPEYVKKISSHESNCIIIDGQSINPWNDISLVEGYAALCILCGELDTTFPNEGWDLIGHEYMCRIQESIEEQGIDSVSIFGGACSIGMAAYSLSCNGKRYSKFINNINQFIIEYVERILEQVENDNNYVKMNDYDVIQGLSGTGRYLLLYKDNKDVECIIKRILRYMISLTSDITVFGHCVPRWYISKENQFTQSDKKIYANGNFNFGMSHGISGPLAFMSLSLMNGIEIDEQKEAIKKIVSTMEEFRYKVKDIIYWPGRIKFEEFKDKKCIKNVERASWCYGTPGIGRAIYLAGKALNNKEYKDVAIEALKGLGTLPKELWLLQSPTFCHGYSGLLKIMNCMYLDTGDEKFKEFSDVILDIILDLYDNNAPFGFFNVDIDTQDESGKYKRFNNSGLLDGSTGVLLTILGLIKSSQTKWDSIFMIN